MERIRAVSPGDDAVSAGNDEGRRPIERMAAGMP